MRKANKLRSLQSGISAARAAGKTISFVPTMGNIHHGHVELVREARRHSDLVVVSIYVNPTQFGDGEDYANYPSTISRDGMILAEEGVDILYLPSDEIMYPSGVIDPTYIEVPNLGDLHCGKYRPGHFRGVTTIVARLFNMVQPDVAFFGMKDYQQLVIVRKMVSDLSMPLDIVGVETVREDDGLAYSSRNFYLRESEREIAPELYRQLQKVKAGISKGTESYNRLASRASNALKKAGFHPEYISITRQHDLLPADRKDRDVVVLASARLGVARLIDNVEVRVRRK